jgi:hypothetical protein
VNTKRALPLPLEFKAENVLIKVKMYNCTMATGRLERANDRGPAMIMRVHSDLSSTQLCGDLELLNETYTLTLITAFYVDVAFHILPNHAADLETRTGIFDSTISIAAPASEFCLNETADCVPHHQKVRTGVINSLSHSQHSSNSEMSVR